MAASVAQAAREQPAVVPSPLLAAGAPMQSFVGHAPAANDAAHTSNGLDPMDFVRANRIHVKDGSLFLDPYLVIHPRELTAENETKLREKLRLTYSINNPSFYESADRLAIALNLAQLVPVSLQARHSKLLDGIKKYNAQVASGVDADLAKLQHDKEHPFASIARDTREKPERDSVGIETLENGVAIYLLLRQKLTEQGYLNPLSSYIQHMQTPDQVLGELAGRIGVSPLQMRTAALHGGLEGVGRLLGLDPAYVADVKQFSAHAATQDFSLNLIEHWHLGRQLLGPTAPLAQKIETGMAARIEKTLAEARAQVRYHFEVPAPVKAEETRIAEALNLVDPIQRQLMFDLGYEISFTPEATADSIAKYKGIYGLHRKAANNLRDLTGTYHIYFSGRGDLKGSMRTLVHEVAHNLWPDQFSSEDVQKIDMLAARDAAHFAAWQGVLGQPDYFVTFEKFFNAYRAGDAAEKAATLAATNDWLAPQGLTVGALFPYMRDARDFQFMVQHAYDTLSVEGARYAKSGYNGTNERFREVISRFAELKQVEYRSEPQLLHFLAPGLDDIWETQYLPHLNRVHAQLVASRTAAHVPAHRDLPVALAPEAAMDAAQQPKVEQRPGTPVRAAADRIADGPPQNSVDATSAALMGGVMNSDRGLAAVNALSAMGITAR